MLLHRAAKFRGLALPKPEYLHVYSHKYSSLPLYIDNTSVLIQSLLCPVSMIFILTSLYLTAINKGLLSSFGEIFSVCLHETVDVFMVQHQHSQCCKCSQPQQQFCFFFFPEAPACHGIKMKVIFKELNSVSLRQ